MSEVIGEHVLSNFYSKQIEYRMLLRMLKMRESDVPTIIPWRLNAFSPARRYKP